MRKKTRRRLAYGIGLLLKCVEVVFAQCSGTPQQIVTIEPLQGYLASPNFPKNYSSNLNCVYELSAPLNAGLVVQLNVVEFDLLGPYSSSVQCLRDYLLLVIIDRVGREHYSQRYCGQLETFPSLNTLQANAKIVFVSSNATAIRHRGFRLHYSFVREVDIRAPISLYNDPNDKYRRECGGSTEPYEISGQIKSPGFPFTYPKNVTCNWLIRVAEGKRIYLRLIHLQLSKTFAECVRACLYIIDGFKHEPQNGQQTSNLPGEIRYCGSRWDQKLMKIIKEGNRSMYYNEEGMKSYLSNGNRVLIRFITTDYPATEQMTARQIDGIAIGFKVLWTEVNSLVATGETKDVECDVGFTCNGGEFCIDNGHNICAERTRLCINETLKCNGISNCAENDNSDEEFCYPEEVFIYVCVLIVGTMIMCLIGCLFHCILRLCRSNSSHSPQQQSIRKNAINSQRGSMAKFSRQEFPPLPKNSIPRQSVTKVSVTKQRRSQNSDLLSLNPTGNDLNPVWQLDSQNASTFIRLNNVQRAQV